MRRQEIRRCRGRRRGRVYGVGLVECDAVAVDDAVAEVDAVAGDTDDALDENVVLSFGIGCGPEEDDGLVVVEFAVGDERGP